MAIESARIVRKRHTLSESNGLATILYNVFFESEGGTIGRETVIDTISTHEGLRAILALNGFPFSTLVEIIHLARICDDFDLRRTVRYEDWREKTLDDADTKWDGKRIKRLILENADFRAGIVNLFYEGASLSILHKHFHRREIRRLSSMRMSFKPHRLIETLVDYGLYYEHAQYVSDSLKELGKQLEN